MITLRQANRVIEAILARGREMNLRPLCVVVTDPGARVKAAQREDGASMLRFEMALGKCVASLALGRSSALVRERQKQGPAFVEQVNEFADHKMFAVGGGELIRNDEGLVVGAAGVTGATEDEDEEIVAYGIRAAGFKTDQDLAHLGPQIRAEP